MKNSLSLLFLVGSFIHALADPVDSLNIKIGQMILIGFPGTKVDPLVLEEVRSGKVGTIIIFEKNIPVSAAAFVPLKKIIWSYQQAAPIPLMVAIDQEGGKVNRLKEKYGFSRSISAQAMGHSPSLDSVRFYAESTAATLAGLGINVNLAPVVDLGINKENTVIYKVGRAFSADPDSVVLLANEFIMQHRRFGVITVLKHFPGHGSSMGDTHAGAVDVTQHWTAAELVPYERLIERGAVDAVMTAHIVNRKLDPAGYPGTLSHWMIDSLLRKRLKFDGLVFSDDMQMHAIEKNFGLEEAIRLTINAGVDILCFSNNISGSEERTVDKVHGIMRKLVEGGQISMERINESYRRVMAVKKGVVVHGKIKVVEAGRIEKEEKVINDSTDIPLPAVDTEVIQTEKKKKKRKKK